MCRKKTPAVLLPSYANKAKATKAHNEYGT